MEKCELIEACMDEVEAIAIQSTTTDHFEQFNSIMEIFLRAYVICDEDVDTEKELNQVAASFQPEIRLDIYRKLLYLDKSVSMEAAHPGYMDSMWIQEEGY